MQPEDRTQSHSNRFPEVSGLMRPGRISQPFTDRGQPLTQPIVELEFEASASDDHRDTWPSGLAVNQATGDIFVLDRDNAKIKVSSGKINSQAKHKLDKSVAPLNQPNS
ncbi:unnamed protein product [Protopolystoma xenopodis]|uniref:SMP-30/Gluconolactonase/LRE-like region domain-containing protein n=1 Tax=Protopolystoma xenopodis TaxID=117903 RepID=A0A3S5CUM9_9PLAT|nr:unnamed protein product [Protopolystoma xenopodis]